MITFLIPHPAPSGASVKKFNKKYRKKLNSTRGRNKGLLIGASFRTDLKTDCLELLDFAVWLVDYVLHLPKKQVAFLVKLFWLAMFVHLS